MLADTVIGVLSDLRLPFLDGDARGIERVQAAVVLLADRDSGRLLAAAATAESDWRDVLTAAGLADAGWPDRLDAALRADPA